jgi:CysZ protein
VVVALAIAVGSVVVAIFTFTALTLTIGDPFYESISKKIDSRLGGGPADDKPWYRTFWRNLGDSVRLLALSIVASLMFLVAGFIPVVGQSVVPVLEAVVMGWLMAMEITGIPFNRRGLRLADRRKLLRANRSLALGFGVPVFLLCLVPLAALVVIPCAVAGGTLLTRRVLRQPDH